MVTRPHPTPALLFLGSERRPQRPKLEGHRCCPQTHISRPCAPLPWQVETACPDGRAHRLRGIVGPDGLKTPLPSIPLKFLPANGQVQPRSELNQRESCFQRVFCGGWDEKVLQLGSKAGCTPINRIKFNQWPEKEKRIKFTGEKRRKKFLFYFF